MVSTRSSSRPETPPVATPQPPPTASRSTNKGARGDAWHYTPSRFTLLWLAISLPLVIWDTIYILGRPHTMEGGWLHWPLFVPYELYGEIDHVYGWKAFNAHSGFSAAQGLLNAVETAMYLVFLRTAYSQGWTVAGREGAKALTIGFSAAVMTLSKTALYWANEYYGGFDNIGHNTPVDLFFLWIIPNGAWLVGSTGMILDMGSSIIGGLTFASAGRSKTE